MTYLGFGTYQAGNADGGVRLLVSSLREFGGRYAGCEMQVGYPAHLRVEADIRAEKQISHLPVAIPAALRDFPFSGKVFAAAQAEAQAERIGVELLAWLDADTLILQEPKLFNLPAGIDLACRPVHHRLIGPAWDAPPDDFWQAIYRACGAAPESNFQMITHVEKEPIRTYINAGALLVRPAAGLLRAWATAFEQEALTETFTRFYALDDRYRIFMHQAVLSGIVIKHLEKQQIRILPPNYNYPLNLNQQVPAARQPKRLDALITARYDEWELEPDWRKILPASPELAAWLDEHWAPRVD